MPIIGDYSFFRRELQPTRRLLVGVDERVGAQRLWDAVDFSLSLPAARAVVEGLAGSGGIAGELPGGGCAAPASMGSGLVS